MATTPTEAAARIGVIDYGVGNLRSVKGALDSLGVGHTDIVSAPIDLLGFDVVILPGVGAFGDAIATLRDRGWVPPLEAFALEAKKPFLGVCLGMQLLFEASHERGRHTGLGWIPGDVVPFDIPKGLRVPHVGWNEAAFRPGEPIFAGLGPSADFYFVHSYHAECPPAHVIGECCYGRPFPAAVRHDNVVGVQFHPERSHHNGLLMLRNFVLGALAEQSAC